MVLGAAPGGPGSPGRPGEPGDKGQPGARGLSGRLGKFDEMFSLVFANLLQTLLDPAMLDIVSHARY